MKLNRKQWLLILMGILLILLLWWMAKRTGTSGAGATSDNREDTPLGDGALPDPGEKSDISGGSMLDFSVPTTGFRTSSSDVSTGLDFKTRQRPSTTGTAPQSKPTGAKGRRVLL